MGRSAQGAGGEEVCSYIFEMRPIWLQVSIQSVYSSYGAGCGASGSQINMKSPSPHRKHLVDKAKCGKWDGSVHYRGHSHVPLCVDVCGPGVGKHG